MIKRALCSQPGLDTPGDSVESKVTTGYKSKISWNHKSSIERADEVNALVVNFLPLLATESPRTIVMAAPALKYAADTHLLHALGGKTKANDFAVVDKLPKKGNLGPGGVHQVAVRTRTGGSDSSPTYTYKLHTYQKNGHWQPSRKQTKAITITFELLDKLRTSGHLPEGTIVEVASPEAIGPAILNVVKASNDVSKAYGFRKLMPTTLAHEYTLNRCDNRDKNSRAVLNLLKMLELDALGFGQSELKHCVGLQVEPEIHVPGTVTHVTYLLKPKSKCKIKLKLKNLYLKIVYDGK